MPSFGVVSTERLSTCHPELQRLFQEVVKHFNCTVVCGFRDKDAQNEAFNTGKSKKQWPYGEHNKTPSLAVDVVPFPIDWKDTDSMRYFAGFVKGVAAVMGITIRWGGDWDNDTDLKDQTFNDFPHFEIKL